MATEKGVRSAARLAGVAVLFLLLPALAFTAILFTRTNLSRAGYCLIACLLLYSRWWPLRFIDST